MGCRPLRHFLIDRAARFHYCKSMTERHISTIFTTGISLLALAGIVIWFTGTAPFEINKDIPGQDNKPQSLIKTSPGKVKIGEYFQNYSGLPSSLTGSWPGFRGPDATNISPDKTPLIDTWNNTLPKVLWEISLGEGHAGPAVHNGRVYILDYDEARQSDTLRCFSLDTGEEIWRRWYRIPMKRNHGISRSIPAVTDNFVVTIGPSTHVMCVDAVDGKFLWGIDLVEEYGAEVPLWYTAQCPFIDNEEVILAAGGDVLLMGVDLKTGAINWKTPNPLKIKMSHSSIMPMYFSGKNMFVYAGIGGTVGISAEPDDRGKLMWQTDKWDNSVIAPSPVVFPDGKIFLTAGYGGGSMMIRVAGVPGNFSVATLYKKRPKEGLACEQQTPILIDNLLYGIMPKDGGEFKNQFVCQDPDSGKIVWSTGKLLTFGLGPFVYADNKFWVLSDEGVLHIIEADRNGFRLLDKTAAIPSAFDAWGPIALVNGRMLLRDSTRLFCIDVRK